MPTLRYQFYFQWVNVYTLQSGDYLVRPLDHPGWTRFLPGDATKLGRSYFGSSIRDKRPGVERTLRRGTKEVVTSEGGRV